MTLSYIAAILPISIIYAEQKNSSFRFKATIKNRVLNNEQILPQHIHFGKDCCQIGISWQYVIARNKIVAAIKYFQKPGF